jgi:hypothetical protein
MKIVFSTSFVALLTILCFASASVCQTAQASEWQKIDADGLFTFRLPQGFSKTNMAGVENYLGEYYKGETRFLFIWGDTASYAYDVRRQPEMEEYQETETSIDGRRANIRTYSQIRDGERTYRAELNIGNWEKADIELYMEIETKDAADLEVAKEIFHSINFSKRKRPASQLINPTPR